LIIKSMSRLVVLGLTVAVGSLAVAPAHAGDAWSPTFPRKATRGPLAASAEARVARLDTSAAAAAQATAPAAASEHKSFFKSGKGIAVILLFVGGTAWTIASANDKRIHSPIR
jgi:hypothetical protein